MDDDLMMCPECGELVDEHELFMYNDRCQVCYDDNHFGEDEFDIEEDE